MHRVWITFRIGQGYAGGRSHDDRYDSLLRAIARHAVDFWVSAATLVVMTTETPIEQVAIDCQRAISPACDMFLVHSAAGEQAIACGPFDAASLRGVMPYVRVIS